MHACMYVRMYVCTCMYVCMYVCVHGLCWIVHDVLCCMHGCMYLHTDVYMHVCLHFFRLDLCISFGLQDRFSDPFLPNHLQQPRNHKGSQAAILIQANAEQLREQIKLKRRSQHIWQSAWRLDACGLLVYTGHHSAGIYSRGFSGSDLVVKPEDLPNKSTKSQVPLAAIS